MLSRAFNWPKLNLVGRQLNWNANSSTAKYTFLSQIRLLSGDPVAAPSAPNKIEDQELAKNNEGNAIKENFDIKTNQKGNQNEQMKKFQKRNYPNKKRDDETRYKNSKSQNETFTSSSTNQSQISNKRYMDNREKYFKNKSEKMARVDLNKNRDVSNQIEVNLDEIKNVSPK